MNTHEDENDITWRGTIGPRAAAAIGAVAGLATSRRKMRGAVVGGAVGWAMAHFLNRRKHKANDVVDVTATEPTSTSDPEPEVEPS